jgi:hypothetical protein
MTEVVYVRREATDQPFGFKLQGLKKIKLT